MLTSGNVSDEPIAYRRRRRPASGWRGIADAFLTHDRRDPHPDRRLGGARRSAARRAGAPPLARLRAGAAAASRSRSPGPVLACGAELKSTFCLAPRGRRRSSPTTSATWRTPRRCARSPRGSSTSGGCSTSTPQVVAHDLHPDYLSTKYAARAGRRAELVGVQHHHAHIASCLADNGEARPGDRRRLRRHRLRHRRHDLGRRVPGRRPGRLRAGRPPGAGADARRRGRDPAAVADGRGLPGRRLPGRLRRPAWRSRPQRAVTGAPCWRWPSAASTRRSPPAPGGCSTRSPPLLGVRDAINYEGQAAIELEQLADPGEPGSYPAAADRRRAAADRRGRPGPRPRPTTWSPGASAPVIAARFHNGVAGGHRATCVALRDRYGLGTVALSGGVFQNLLLLDRVVTAAGGRGLPGADPPPGALQRRRDQPRPGGGRGGPARRARPPAEGRSISVSRAAGRSSSPCRRRHPESAERPSPPVLGPSESASRIGHGRGYSSAVSRVSRSAAPRTAATAPGRIRPGTGTQGRPAAHRRPDRARQLAERQGLRPDRVDHVRAGSGTEPDAQARPGHRRGSPRTPVAPAAAQREGRQAAQQPGDVVDQHVVAAEQDRRARDGGGHARSRPAAARPAALPRK